MEEYRSGTRTARTISGSTVHATAGAASDADLRRTPHRHQAVARASRRLVDDRRRARERRLRRRCARCSPRAIRADVQEQVKVSGLRGRGGANFPTGQKWSFLPADLFPRYLVVNGDEGEPSTFKDRMLVERDPHQLVEGIIISAFAIQCNQAFVYLRGEFALGYDRLTQALDDAQREGLPRHEHPRLGLRPRDRRAPRRGRVHLRRGDRAHRVARRRARHAAAQAAVPRDRRPLRQADGRQQRRDALDGAAHRDDGRRRVRRDRREQVDRHARRRDLGPRQEARATTRSSSAARSAT